ncbi:hypothetical protein QAD02_019887 [Eretmocerus hayati]|uniref:Uncharacterized protein n=1 Tax=Eretmocerus hayati TaxID=131215 RepID=A0ACC2PL15_9HYME|nr:hypothetical protein QAD02_019887 [Eretmocerus hayati]
MSGHGNGLSDLEREHGNERNSGFIHKCFAGIQDLLIHGRRRTPAFEGRHGECSSPHDLCGQIGEKRSSRGNAPIQGCPAGRLAIRPARKSVVQAHGSGIGGEIPLPMPVSMQAKLCPHRKSASGGPEKFGEVL